MQRRVRLHYINNVAAALCTPTKNRCSAAVESGGYAPKRKKMGLFLWNGRLFFVESKQKFTFGLGKL